MRIKYKKGQGDIFQQITAILILLIFVGAIGGIISGMSCTNEKNQIKDLTNKLNNCQSTLNSYLPYVQNCSQNIQNIENECLEKVENATSSCNSKILFLQNILNNYNIQIILYTFTLSISILFAFNLFSFGFQIKFGKKLDSLLEKYDKFWNWFKFGLFVISVIITLVLLWNFFSQIKV